MNYIGSNGPSALEQYHMLELVNVSHSGPILPISKQSCWSKLTGSTPKGLILKDVVSILTCFASFNCSHPTNSSHTVIRSAFR